ncbi:hypothetical protein JNK62_04155 [bacterium]|nr:hypothetical protein [bacterium]
MDENADGSTIPRRGTLAKHHRGMPQVAKVGARVEVVDSEDVDGIEWFAVRFEGSIINHWLPSECIASTQEQAA